MQKRPGERRIPPAIWTLLLLSVIVVIIAVTAGLFTGSFRTFVPVTLEAQRSGLVMETGAKVKLRGVQVGRVSAIEGGSGPVRLRLDLFPDQVRYIPANVSAEVRATTAFGAKYVDLIYPEQPSAAHIAAGAVVRSRNVSTEVNTVFQNVVQVLRQVDPPKLNAVATALSDGVRGQGERMGTAITAANEVLRTVNPRMGTVAADWRAFGRFADAYTDASQDILSIIDGATATSVTLVNQADDLDVLLLNIIGLAHEAITLLGPNMDNFVSAINGLEPTTELLFKYSPSYTCLLMGAKWYLDNGGYRDLGGNGRTLVVDAALLLGDDPYKYPENLPIVAAKGGPGGKPSCGSLPDASKNFPVRQLVTNTGFGTGLDHRPNPGIGFPGWMNLFPVTRVVPEPPVIRNTDGRAPPPRPAHPGESPYGAPHFTSDGAPLYYPPAPAAPFPVEPPPGTPTVLLPAPAPTS